MPSFNLQCIAIGAVLAASLAVANYNQLSRYFATQGEVQSIGDCPTFSLSSWGDPHIENNFATIDNTAGGATQVSTTVAEDKQYGMAVNSSISLEQPENGGWSITASQKHGTLKIAITDAGGTRSLRPGQTVQEAGGTTIMMNTNGTATALQPLSRGGIVSSTIEPDQQKFGDNRQGVSMYMQGKGEAIINGMASQPATGFDSALLPCIGGPAGRENGAAGSSDTGGFADPAQQSSM